MRFALLLLLALPVCCAAQHLYLVNHDEFEVSSAGANLQAATRPASGEQLADLQKSCPQFPVTSVKEKADFVIDWSIKTWEQTSWSGHQNEFAVYDRAGDVIAAGQTHRASAAAKDICSVIQKKWKGGR